MKTLLISLMVALTMAYSFTAKADIEDDCIKCPGLQTIFDLKYKYVMVA